MSYEIHDQSLTVLKELKSNGYHIISLEITDTSEPINVFRYANDKPDALVVGDENFGISEEILELSDDIVHIEMYGKNSSMNAVQSGNIALYEITRQLK